MQTTINVSKDLTSAIDIVEEILNSKDGEAFIDSLKKYKQTKEIDDEALLQIKKYLI